jgi:hypothetical protein
MKRVIALVPLTLVALLLPVLPAQAGVAVASVTFVNAVTYDAGQDFPLTVCLDGVAQGEELSTGTFLGPVDIAPGDYFVSFVQGTDCTDDGFVEDTITVPADGNITVMAWWGLDDRGISVLANDISCIDEGLARITLRHAGAATALDMSVTPEGGTSTEIITGVDVGDQGTADLAAGPYSSGLIETVGGVPVIALGSQTLEPGSAYTLYVYGGNDGDIGYFLGPVVPLDPCAEPTSTSTSTSVAVAAETRPTFTG